MHSVWCGFNVNLIKKEKLRKIALVKKVNGYVHGCTLKFNVNLVIKNNEKTPQHERVLVDTLAGEGNCVCVLGSGHSLSTYNVQVWYRCAHNKTPQ